MHSRVMQTVTFMIFLAECRFCQTQNSKYLKLVHSLGTVPETKNCVLVTYRLDQRYMKAAHSIQSRGIINLSAPTIEYWYYPQRFGSREASTIIGLSPLEHVLELADTSVDASLKQLVVLEDGLVDQVNQTKIELDPRHHPLLKFYQQYDKVLVTAMCQTGEEKVVDVFTNADWFAGNVAFFDHTERICNHGHNEVFGKTLKAAIFGVEPWVYFNSQFTGVSGGIAVDLLHVVSQMLHFKVELLLSNSWGHIEPDGTYVGTSAMATRGPADLGVEDYVQPVTDESEHYDRETNPELLYLHDFIFVVKRPEELPPHSNIIHVLDQGTWIVFFCTLGLVTVVMLLLAHREKEDLGKVLWDPYGIVFGEFHGVADRSFTALALLRLLWILTAFLITAAFAGNLKASLVVTTFQDGVNSIADMLEKGLSLYITTAMHKFLIAFYMDDAYGEQILKRAEDRNTIYPMSPNIVEEMFSRVDENGGAAVYYTDIYHLQRGNYMMKALDYPLTRVPQGLMPNYIAYVFKYQDPRARLFSPVILRMKDAGIVDRAYRKYLPYRGIKDQLPEKDTKLVLAHLYLPILTWGILLILGFFYFCQREMSAKA